MEPTLQFHVNRAGMWSFAGTCDEDSSYSWWFSWIRAIIWSILLFAVRISLLMAFFIVYLEIHIISFWTFIASSVLMMISWETWLTVCLILTEITVRNCPQMIQMIQDLRKIQVSAFRTSTRRSFVFKWIIVIRWRCVPMAWIRRIKRVISIMCIGAFRLAVCWHARTSRRGIRTGSINWFFGII